MTQLLTRELIIPPKSRCWP